MGSVERRILEGIRRRQEDSELQQYATEPPGAMGEQDDDDPNGVFGVLFKPGAKFTYYEFRARARKKKLFNGEQWGSHMMDWGQKNGVIKMIQKSTSKDKARYEFVGKNKDAEPTGEMEFTIDEDSPLDENEWMTLDEMDLTCEACAGRMRKRKMTRIKRSEAQECMAKFGKKPDGE